MFKKFKFGFTIAETFVVLVILGVVSVLTISMIMQQDKVREKQINSTSKLFFSNVENVYHQILTYNAINGVITAIDDKNSDGNIDSQDLRELFNYYMDGEDTECSELGIDLTGETGAAKYLKDAVCSSHPKNVIAGYYLDTDCDTEVNVKETLTIGDMTPRNVKKACGYIVYGIRPSKGVLGVDAFTIALGKIGLK